MNQDTRGLLIIVICILVGIIMWGIVLPTHLPMLY